MTGTLKPGRGAGIVACLLSLFAVWFALMVPVTALAGETDDGSVFIRSYEIEDGYTLVNSGVGYVTEYGEISYCFDFTAHGPGRDGKDYTDAMEGTNASDYVLAMGYPNSTVFAGKQWSAGEAQAITQLAAWIVSGTADESSGSFATAEPEVLAAAKSFAAEAQAYQGGDPSIDGCSSILYVSGDPSVQAMLAARVGACLSLTKCSADEGVTLGNDEYSLSGAVYGVFDSSGAQVAQLVTDQDGFAKTESRLAPGSYTVREIEASPGYVVSPQEYAVEITSSDVAVSAEEIPVTVRLTLVKTDAETGGSSPQGAASLDGAEYEASYLYGGERKTVAGTVEGGQVVFDGIPLGEIEVRETKAPEGYLLDTAAHVFNVTAEMAGNEAAVFEYAPEEGLPDQVIRGDLQLVKVHGVTGGKMGGVPFKVTSKTTGESHLIVTDDGGCASTSADYVPHTVDTNGGAAGSGVWFGSGDPDDSQGALPYDTYLVEEQECDANAGLELAPAFEVEITEDGVTVDLGTVVNDGGRVQPADESDGGVAPSNSKASATGASAKTGDYFPLCAVVVLGALACASAAVAFATIKGKSGRIGE